MKYIDLKTLINRPYFTNNDIRLNGLAIFKYQYDLWQKKNYIIQAKRGVYIFSEYKEKLSGFFIAQLIYNPSYISLESALSQYGLIPEYVPSTTSVTTRTTRLFSNDFGTFYFRHLRNELFWGYVTIENQFEKYYLAEPEKAILDYIYLNNRSIKNDADLESIRLNYEKFNETINIKKFIQYAKAYDSKKILKLTKSIIKMAKENADS